MNRPADGFSSFPPPALETDGTDDRESGRSHGRLGLVVAVAVVVVAAVVSIVIWRTGGSDSSSAAPTHLVNYSSDAIVVSDADGTHPRRITVPDGFSVAGGTAVQGRFLLGLPETGRVRRIDLATGEVQSVVLSVEADYVPDANAGGHTVLLKGRSDGTVWAADFATGTATQLGDPSLSYVAYGVRDGVAMFGAYGLKSSALLVPVDRPSAAWEVAAVVVDVRGATTLTVERNSDGTSVVSEYEGDRLNGAPVKFDTRLAGGMLNGKGAMVIDLAGKVSTLDFGKGSHAAGPDTGRAVDGARPVGAERLFAWGATGSVLLASDGSVVANFDPGADSTGASQPLVPFALARGSDCIGVQYGFKVEVKPKGAALLDLKTGKRLLSFDAPPTAKTADGCSLTTISTPLTLVIDRKVRDLGVEVVLAVSPDHSHVVAGIATGGSLAMYLIEVGSGKRTPLAKGLYYYAQF